MMQTMNGSVISGEIFPEKDEFYVKKIKNFETESILNLNQINAIYDYLSKASHYDNFHIVTINDQLLIKLNNEEIQLMLKDFDQVKNGLNSY